MYIDATQDNFYGLSYSIINQYFPEGSAANVAKLDPLSMKKLQMGYTCAKRTCTQTSKTLRELNKQEIPI